MEGRGGSPKLSAIAFVLAEVALTYKEFFSLFCKKILSYGTKLCTTRLAKVHFTQQQSVIHHKLVQQPARRGGGLGISQKQEMHGFFLAMGANPCFPFHLGQIHPPTFGTNLSQSV